jgi:hypothetical protein
MSISHGTVEPRGEKHLALVSKVHAAAVRVVEAPSSDSAKNLSISQRIDQRFSRSPSPSRSARRHLRHEATFETRSNTTRSGKYLAGTPITRMCVNR